MLTNLTLTRRVGHYVNKYDLDGTTELTLGTREVARLLARDDSAVDVALEHSIGNITESVVGLDILLDSLTTVDNSC